MYPVLTPQQQEKREIRRSSNFCGGIILAMTAVQTILSLALGLFAGFGVLDVAQTDWGLGFVGYEILNMLLYVLFLPVPVILLALVTRFRVNPLPSRAVKPWLVLCLFPLGMAMAIVSNVITNYFMMFMQALGVPYPQFPDTLLPNTTSLWLNIVATAVLPALAEELVFRGYMQGALKPYGERMAVVLTAFIFGLFHGNILQFPFAFMLGLVMGWMTVQTGSIWPAVITHFGNNLMSVLLEYFGKVYPNWNTVLGDVVFFIIAAAGVCVVAALLVLDRRGSGRTDVFRPLQNGVTTLSVRRRVWTVLTAPAMLIAMIVMVLQLVSSIVLS